MDTAGQEDVDLIDLCSSPSSSTFLLCTCGQPLKLPVPWLLHVKNGEPKVVKLMRGLNKTTYEQRLEQNGS